jgi:hypothetical protein
MATEKKPVMIYIDDEQEEKLLEFCHKHKIYKRFGKNRVEKPSMGTAIYGILNVFFEIGTEKDFDKKIAQPSRLDKLEKDLEELKKIVLEQAEKIKLLENNLKPKEKKDDSINQVKVAEILSEKVGTTIRQGSVSKFVTGELRPKWENDFNEIFMIKGGKIYWKQNT